MVALNSKSTVSGAQPSAGSGVKFRSAIGCMSTVVTAEPVQPSALVPTTVYCVVAVGLAITAAPVDADRLEAGLQLYD
jgi:hypothetical protein